MDNVYVFEGKTSTEAIDKGLKELGVSKSKVNIKILDQEDKRSFFSILTPRVVKVEITLKEGEKEESKTATKPTSEANSRVTDNTRKVERTEEELNAAVADITKFMDELTKSINTKLDYSIKIEDEMIKVNIDGDETGFLIGYRGEVLNSLQLIISNIACKSSKEKIRVSLNISGYREKREKDLEILASKIAGTVIKRGKDITLEPMSAYERKIIHTKLQDNNRVKTYSIGEEPHRKVVVSLNRK
ncbi:MAG: Jag N-terminal domain-containing protein [Clostridia bacterium]|nr:Jag N-terminal domain-containing protein [Clostridia bacterium]